VRGRLGGGFLAGFGLGTAQQEADVVGVGAEVVLAGEQVIEGAGVGLGVGAGLDLRVGVLVDADQDHVGSARPGRGRRLRRAQRHGGRQEEVGQQGGTQYLRHEIRSFRLGSPGGSVPSPPNTGTAQAATLGNGARMGITRRVPRLGPSGTPLVCIFHREASPVNPSTPRRRCRGWQMHRRRALLLPSPPLREAAERVTRSRYRLGHG
jgi:hypothetical protein